MLRRSHPYSGNDELPVYVINLDRRPDRWRFQTAQARLHRLSITRVSASDGAAERARFPHAALTDGEIGLWATFDTLVSRLAREGVTAAVVLEDDAMLSIGFRRRLSKILSTASEDVALVQLGFLTDSTWRPTLTLWQNLRKVLRPRSRLTAIRESITNGRRTTAGVRGGTHALLIFPARLWEYLLALRPVWSSGQALDEAFIAASQMYPRVFIRVSQIHGGPVAFPFRHSAQLACVASPRPRLFQTRVHASMNTK